MGRKRHKPASPAVLVVWTDASFSSSTHWASGTQPPRPKGREHLCVSVGWLTSLDDAFLQLTQTLADGNHAHVANIPRGMVESVTVLEPVAPLEGA